jgi:hypothetical protein
MSDELDGFQYLIDGRGVRYQVVLPFDGSPSRMREVGPVGELD